MKPKLTDKEEPKKTNEATRFSSENQPDKNGCHLKFESEEEIQREIDDYFSECNERKIEVYDKRKQEVVTLVSQVPYTIEGLCEALDMNRESLLRYGKKDRFYDTIRKAKNTIQRNKMERGLEGLNNSSVTIFDMKNNHDYKDAKEISGPEGGAIETVKLDPEQYAKIRKDMIDKDDC